jgi:hypothetical protein
VIPTSVIDSLLFYVKENVLSPYLDINDNNVLQSLEINNIHTNKGNLIQDYLRIFNIVIYEMECEGVREEIFEEMDSMYLIIESLKKREKAIEDITTDVLKRREDCCCY